MKDSHILKRVLLVLGFVLIIGALYLVFLYVPTEQSMGVVQRIFYFHVPVAWVAMLAFGIIFVCSILYLWKRESKWDIIASSSAEVGVIFASLLLITGSIWAKPAWGVWWTWDVRLTTALVLWIIYIAYLIIRSYVTEEQRGARFAAVIGIVGFIDIPIVALAIKLWRTQHASPVIFEGGLTPSMLLTLMVSITAFTVLFVLLLLQRISMKKDEIEVKRLKDTFG